MQHLAYRQDFKYLTELVEVLICLNELYLNQI